GGGANLTGNNSTQVVDVTENGNGLAMNAIGSIQVTGTFVSPAIRGSSGDTGVSGYSDGNGDGVVGQSFAGIGVHALAGQSYGGPALLAEGNANGAISATSG